MKKQFNFTLVTFFFIFLLSCQKDRDMLEKNAENKLTSNLLESKNNTAGLRSSFSRTLSAEVGTTSLVDSMTHISSGSNVSKYIPWHFIHYNEGANTTNYIIPHYPDGPNKTRFGFTIIHVTTGNDVSKSLSYHDPGGANPTTYYPNSPGYYHLTEGPNKSYFVKGPIIIGGGGIFEWEQGFKQKK